MIGDLWYPPPPPPPHLDPHQIGKSKWNSKVIKSSDDWILCIFTKQIICACYSELVITILLLVSK